MAGARIVVAKGQFVAEVDGRTVVVIAGARFAVASEVVRTHPERFETLTRRRERLLAL